MATSAGWGRPDARSHHRRRGGVRDGGIVSADVDADADLLWVVYATSTPPTGRSGDPLGELVPAAPRDLTSILYLFAQRRGAPIARAIIVYASADTDAAAGR
ncbi:hypothetical protein Vau01_124060 [Virgisporangium aurantiacum]|uniref:Uncharacterized protein n=1 Tax=Virgisporangium aurantiacum TaxID=175570 RepID=A0A8J3ZMW8_9ACTN|nr:hypothetical protein Vau01_124060 [Virgisporangium aurantiacum]